MAGRLKISRRFLGWAGPALPRAADLLLEARGGDAAAGDLSGLLVVVPGGRAQRRLIELLAERAAERGMPLIPPRVVTVGGLASRLMPTAEGGSAIADEQASLLVRARVLREAEAGLIRAFTPRTPAAEDWPGWWSLARRLGQLADELGTVGLTPNSAVDRHDLLLSDPCWAAAAELDRRYHEALAAVGLVDTHAARRDASLPLLAGNNGDLRAPADGPRIVLLATPDLRPMHTRLLDARAGEVTAFIFAPESHAAGFDEWGVLRPAYWLKQALPIDDDALVMTGRPEDQSAAVLRTLETWSADEPLRPDAVSVGLGDETLGGVIQRSLELAGVPARAANGRPVTRSRPVLLLEALGTLATDNRFDRLATLLRHPDLLAYVQDAAQTPHDNPAGGWLGLLDRYATDHLQGDLTGHWLGRDEQREQLAAVYRAVQGLLPEDEAHAKRPLGEWAGPIGAALQAVYGRSTLRRHAPDDRPVVLGLSALGDVLERMGALTEDDGYAPRTTFAQAVRFVLAQLDSAPVPEPGGASAVELLGLLELPLDDAERIIVVGMNEGAVPQPIADHPMLPRAVRNELGLHDDDDRLARDQLLMASVVASRPSGSCVMVAGRVGPAGDPLMPSRLILRGEDSRLTQRVACFFDAEAETGTIPTLLTPGKADRFIIPPPMLETPVLDRLSVTAFRDYLACPYRFYLKHICKLRVLDDRAVELDGGAFGSLAHDALRVLGEEAMRDEGRADVLYERLSAALDQRVRLRYGAHPRPAVRLQVEQLRYRLQAAAREQAGLFDQGWRVLHVEGADRAGRLERVIEIDGEPFTLTGKIDRIDRHTSGTYRVIDYKTSDTAKSPEQTHRQGPKSDKHWTDLQLPLYRELCATLEVPADGLELAYFNVPKKLAEVGVSTADWDADALREADAERDRVIRALRARCYWPPSEPPPKFDDGLAGVCADHAEGRVGVVRTVSGLLQSPGAASADGGQDG